MGNLLCLKKDMRHEKSIDFSPHKTRITKRQPSCSRSQSKPLELSTTAEEDQLEPIDLYQALVERRYLDAFYILQRKRLHINAVDDYGNTVLHMYSENFGFDRTAYDIIVEFAPDVLVKNLEGKSAYQVAVEKGNLEIQAALESSYPHLFCRDE